MSDKPVVYNTVAIFGCGDIGTRVARLWQDQNISVHGIVRSETSLQCLADLNIPAEYMDLDCPDTLALALTRADLVYYFVPPPNSGTRDTRCRNLLTKLESSSQVPGRIIAISTTGIYGDCKGKTVNEDQPPNPQVDRARRRLDMENQLRAWCAAQSVDLIILRVGGIYGPGRLPLKRIREGVPVLLPELSPSTNRIHADDLAQICKQAAFVDHRYRVYNVSDGTESNMTEYFFTIADYFGLPRPPAVDWQEAESKISPGMLSYLRESRRVDNRRMLNELNVTLRYPDLTKGLASCRETSG